LVQGTRNDEDQSSEEDVQEDELPLDSFFLPPLSDSRFFLRHKETGYLKSAPSEASCDSWKLHETSDLTSIVTTLYKAGPTMAIADPLSRLVRQEHRVENLDLPVLLEMLLSELPDDIRKALHIRVNTEKDTHVVTRMVQRWRKPTNPISNTIGPTAEKLDLFIAAPYADKLPLKVAEYIR
jgi:hypothetical protein